MPSFSVLWSLKVFYFQAPLWSLNHKPSRILNASAGKLKDQPMKKMKFNPAKMRLFALVHVMGLLALSSARAQTLAENFTNDPSQNGWVAVGDTTLFHWDSTNDVMDVTWDSSRPNSFFCHPLGTTLCIADSFTVSFDIQLDDIEWSNYPALAVGLLNFSEATNSAFSRSAVTTPNLFEYDYYPDDGLGQANVAATLADMTVSATNDHDFYFIFDYLPMNPATTYRITLTHTAGEPSLTATMSVGGTIYTKMPYTFSGPISDFRLDTVSINSYEDDFNPLLAHGTVGNFVITLPAFGRNPIITSLGNGIPQLEFGTYTNWTYTLERSTNLVSWDNVSASMPGTGEVFELSDTNAPFARSYYRVAASRP